jgi:bifunctional DNA-binding transcriptional regulator/antitoxin component of YhaV-PrlF toxin-antitoxin module
VGRIFGLLSEADGQELSSQNVTLNSPSKDLGELPMTAITIDDTGCLAIPLEIRQQLGITIAQSLNLEIINGCIILKPVGREPKVHRKGTALVVETPPLGNLNTFIDDLREEHIQSQIS